MSQPSRLSLQRLAVLIVTLCLLSLVLAGYGYQQGWHRSLVYHLYERMHHGELVAPSTVRRQAGDSPYDKWYAQNRDTLPSHDTLVIDDINTIELRPWPELGLGVRGLYLRFSDYQVTDGRLLEIPAGHSTLPQRHLYEIGTYILSGSGYTLISSAGREDELVEWQAGSLFSTPVLDSYRHVNNGDQPVRMLAVTAFPFLVNSFDNDAFAGNAELSLLDRRAPVGEFRDFREDTGELIKKQNFVEDVTNVETRPNRSRGRTNRGAYWQMSGNSVLGMHVSEFAPRSFKKAHRHSSEAFILIVSGVGYSLIWKETQQDYQRIDWKPGTLFVPPNFWYHQHFNPGDEAARYLVINTGIFISNIGLRFYNQLEIDDPRVVDLWNHELQGYEGAGKRDQGSDRP